MNDQTHKPGDIQAVIDSLKSLLTPQTVKLREPDQTPDGDVPVLLLPKGIEAHSIKRFVDEWAHQPPRRAGTAKLTDLDSFIALANRFKDADSAIFVGRDRAAPSFTAVIDYHLSGEQTPDESMARFGRHRLVYAPALDPAWTFWHQTAGQGALTQVDFAELIEDRADDLAPIPDLSGPMGRIAAKLAASFASPLAMMELAKGLHINENAQAKHVVNLQSGEQAIRFESEHRDAAGAPVAVPKLFCLAIPVFDRGPLYEVAVRLRYRLRGPVLTWHLIPYRTDKIFDHAFDEMVERVRAECALPVLAGTPEAAT